MLLLWFVLGTDYGTQQGFKIAARWLPLTYQQVEGNALKQLRVQGLSYQDDSIELIVAELDWSLNLAALWQQPKQLHIESLLIDGAHIKLLGNPEAETAPSTEPFSINSVESAISKLPVGIAIDSLVLKSVELQQAGQHYAVHHLQTDAKLTADGQLSLSAKLENGPFDSQAQFSLMAHIINGAAQADLNIDHINANWQQAVRASGKAQLLYNKQALQFRADSLQASYGSASVKLNGQLAPGQNLSFDLSAPSLTLAHSELAGSANIRGQISNAKQFTLKANAQQLTWLGEPQLQQATIDASGDLSKQTLNAELRSQHWGQAPLLLNIESGWLGGSWQTLLDASALTPEALLAHPALQLKVSLALASADIASTGIRPQQNLVTLERLDGGKIALHAESQSGDGKLLADGTLALIRSANADVAVSATLNGPQYQLVQTPELTLSASPRLDIQLAQQQLRLRGDITVDHGHIELVIPEDGAITPSSDVVFVDDSAADGSPANTATSTLKRDIQLTLIIEEPVTIKGQGFDGEASGKLTVTEGPGQQPRARGELVLAGRYKAYGQDLTIRRGKLIYVDSPLDDPGVDLEAIRSVGEQIAGVRVSGLASNPQIEIFAEPALSETEALAYLVLGRGLDANSERDQNQLRNLALSLGLSKGSKFLEKSKHKLGVDELSIQTGDSNNDASLLLGRQLSKRLYLSTQIGLFEPVSKLLLRYQLSRKCDLVAETGSQQGADLICTISSKAN
jgi:autotransporter translocation and assembly factor TamB